MSEMRSVKCPICEREVRFEVASSSKPEIPELFQPEEPDTWFGVVRGDEGAPEVVGVCSRRCRDVLFSVTAGPLVT